MILNFWQIGWSLKKSFLDRSNRIFENRNFDRSNRIFKKFKIFDRLNRIFDKLKKKSGFLWQIR